MSKERKKGNRTIERSFTFADGVAIFHVMSRKRGFKYIDRWGKVPARSVWINPKERIVYTYCEGDLIKVTCDNQGAFLIELREANEFYKQF